MVFDLSTQPVILEMINTVLDELGYGVVHTLDNTPIVDSILNHMNIVRKQFLFNGGEGWTFNVMDITPVTDANGEILVPSKTLGIISDNPYLVVRNGRLYDVKNDTTKNLVFEKLAFISLLDYEAMTINMQQYIAYATAHRRAISEGLSESELNRLYQISETYMQQVGFEELGRMAKEEGSAFTDNTNDYTILSRRLLNNKY